jgi:hypothetical protein
MLSYTETAENEVAYDNKYKQRYLKRRPKRELTFG